MISQLSHVVRFYTYFLKLWNVEIHYWFRLYDKLRL